MRKTSVMKSSDYKGKENLGASDDEGLDSSETVG